MQPAQHLIAIHVRHHHIQQNEIRPGDAGGDAQALLAALGGQYAIDRGKQIGQHHQILGSIVDDQDGGGLGREHGASVTQKCQSSIESIVTKE
ncbi:hypothetical protein D3C79_824330 [compost metagenome]